MDTKIIAVYRKQVVISIKLGADYASQINVITLQYVSREILGLECIDNNQEKKSNLSTLDFQPMYCTNLKLKTQTIVEISSHLLIFDRFSCIKNEKKEKYCYTSKNN